MRNIPGAVWVEVFRPPRSPCTSLTCSVHSQFSYTSNALKLYERRTLSYMISFIFPFGFPFSLLPSPPPPSSFSPNWFSTCQGKIKREREWECEPPRIIICSSFHFIMHACYFYREHIYQTGNGWYINKPNFTNSQITTTINNGKSNICKNEEREKKTRLWKFASQPTAKWKWRNGKRAEWERKLNWIRANGRKNESKEKNLENLRKQTKRNGSWVLTLELLNVHKLIYISPETGKYRICPLNSMLCVQYFCAVNSCSKALFIRYRTQ